MRCREPTAIEATRFVGLPHRRMEMEKPITAGMTVKLKSGGPPMTVIEVLDDRGVPTTHCVWFEDAKRCEGNFPSAGLVEAGPG